MGHSDNDQVSSAPGLDRPLRWSLGLLTVAIVLAPELFASARTPFLAPIAGLVMGSAVLASSSTEGASLRRPARLLLGTALFLVVYTGLQLVPLPAQLLQKLAPFSADAWSRALHPLGKAGPAFAPITVDTFATWQNVQRGVLYFLALLATVRVARSRDGTRRVEGALLASVLLLAVVSLVHGLAELPEVFGFYVPTQALGRHMGPVFNPNHLSEFITIGFAIALAWALAPEPPMPRVLAFVLAGSLFSTQIWVASRGGVGASLVTAILVLAATWYARNRGKTLGFVAIATLASVGLGAALIVLGSSDGAWSELLEPSLEKLDGIKATLRLVPHAPLTGVGRGAFESAFPLVQHDPVSGTWETPESLLPQWLCEWGIPATIIAVALISYSLRIGIVLERAVQPIGAWAALWGVALQNMADFGSEVPSIGLLCTACAGVCVAGSAGRIHPFRDRFRWRFVAWTTGGVLVVLSFWLGLRWEDEVSADRERMHRLLLDPAKTPVEVDALYTDAALRHPAEPYFPYLRVYRSATLRLPDLVSWASRTLERQPHHGAAKLALARFLVDKNPSQARDYYRRAATDDAALIESSMREGLRIARTGAEAQELLPHAPEPARPAALAVLVSVLSTRMPATSLGFENALAELAPGNESLLELRAARSLAALRFHMPWCAGEGLENCLRTARISARDLQMRFPARCRGHALEAEALLAAGFPEEGVALLKRALDVVAERSDCHLKLVEFAGKSGLREVMTQALDELTAGACFDPNGCVGRLMAIAHLELVHGNPARALSAYERAHEAEPENLGILEGLANLAVRLGRHRQAAESLAKLLDAKPDRADFRRSLREEERRLAEALARPSGPLVDP